MKKRYIYSLLFGIPGFFLSLIIAMFISGATAGFLWIFVFGDNPWPTTGENILPVILILSLFVCWSAFIVSGFIIGKSLEANPESDTKHIMISAAATALPIILIGLHQFRIGNIGPVADTVLCSRFCSEKGYSGSGMPPKDSGDRTCSCYGNDGKETLRIPITSSEFNMEIN